ncbi:MAG: hypothetical protein IRZ21_02850 [Thermoleophilaceae bacterium]|nr:hypothetical protein [Thermoleophilaceae bacterium]
MRRPSKVLTLVVGCAALALPASALASPDDVIRDCAKDGKLDHRYSQSDLRKAKQQLPSDIDEYTDCRDVIAQAQVSGSGGGSGTGGSGGAGGSGAGGSGGAGGSSGSGIAATPDDVKALEQVTRQAREGKAPPLSVGGKPVEPGEGGLLETAAAANGLPGPVLAALVAVGLLSAAGGWVALRRRLPALEGLKVRLPTVPFPNVRSAAVRIFRR